MITTVNELPMRSKEDTVNIRMDIAIDLPKEVADEAEALGICEFDSCKFDRNTRVMTATYATTYYRKGD